MRRMFAIFLLAVFCDPQLIAGPVTSPANFTPWFAVAPQFPDPVQPKPPTAKLPESLGVGVGVAVKLESEFAGKSRWMLRDKDPQVQLIASDGGKSVIFCSSAPGEHVVVCVGEVEGQEARCCITVGAGPGPKPPGPKPAGPDPYVKLPEMVQASGVMLVLRAETNGDAVWWILPDVAGITLFPPDLLKDTKAVVLIIAGAPAGKYPVYAYTALGNKSHAAAKCLIMVGEGPDPKPPDPKPPDPKPPDPKPKPDKAPIPLPGLRVLIVFDKAGQIAMPAGQQEIVYGAEMRTYLNAKCVVGPDGKTKDWWILDKAQNVTALPKYWQDAFARPRVSVPWLLVSDGKSGFEGPLPANLADMMTILKKFGE